MAGAGDGEARNKEIIMKKKKTKDMEVRRRESASTVLTSSSTSGDASICRDTGATRRTRKARDQNTESP